LKLLNKYPANKKASALFIISGLVTLSYQTVLAKEEDFAKKLANPVSSLISVPIQANYDSKIGVNDKGSVWRINVQPVIPFSISKNWNVISRTILPVISQNNIPVKGAGEYGIGDIVQSFFFSPKQPTSNGIIWGVGPVLLLNTSSNNALGGQKWGAGPTGVLLRQSGPWTYGILSNHIESFSGNNRPGVSVTLMQPFLTYITKSKTTFSLNTETTYN